MLSETLNGFLEKELKGLEEAFLSRIKRLSKENLSQIEIIKLANELDLFNELQDLGLTKIIQKLDEEYSSIVESLLDQNKAGTAGLNIEQLKIIARLDAESLLGRAEAYANQFKSKWLKGLLAGEDTATIADSLEDIGLRSNQVISAITTAKDEFNAIATATIFENDPEQRFVLAGPFDKRTRCQCRAVLDFQPEEGLTKQEIDEGAWTRLAKEHCPKFKGEYTWTFRGGFNCRHYPEPV